MPGFNAADIFTYLLVEMPVAWYLISKIVLASIATPPEFMMSSETHWAELDTFLYTLVTTNALWVVEGVGCADVNGATQYQTATADITRLLRLVKLLFSYSTPLTSKPNIREVRRS